jgi:hypothetical protein
MKRLTFLALLLAAAFPCLAENPAPIKALMV